MPGAIVVAVWFLVLFVAGSGVGAAFPHLTVAALGASAEEEEEEEECAKASAGINTVLIIASAFSAAAAGVLVHLGAPDVVTSARYLMSGFAVAAVLGVVPAAAAMRRYRVPEGDAAPAPAHPV